jgi:hypothetical protein
LIEFSENLLACGLKKAPRSFDCCKLNFMGHRWYGVMAIWKF